MNIQKRLVALLCALALVAGVTAVSLAASSTTTVYLLAVNDKMADLPGGVRPLNLNGVIYVPYTTFDRAATGADLGVYYGIDRAQDTTLTLYSVNSMLVFRVYQGICEDGQGNRMNFRHILRYGIIYVPMASVCAFFGLTYSVLPTKDRGTLVRITNGSSTMTDAVFLDLARQRMLERYNNIVQSMTPQPTATPTPTRPAAPTPTPTPAPGEKEKVPVYLAVDTVGSDSGDWLEFAGAAPLLILFDPGELAGQSGLVRKAVAGGFTIGFRVEGTLEEALEQLERGNELLSHIARIRTHVVSAPAELTQGLAQEGWSCWQSNVSGATAASVLANLESMRVPARLTLSAGVSADQVIRRLVRNEDYILCRPLETDLGV